MNTVRNHLSHTSPLHIVTLYIVLSITQVSYSQPTITQLTSSHERTAHPAQ